MQNINSTEPGSEIFPSTRSVPVSVLIPTRNEESNIVACLDSVGWAKECVVVDSGSTDRTRKVASDWGASVITFTWKPGTPKKKNWSLEHYPFANEWILVLDADERITPTLAKEIATAIHSGLAEGYYINRKFYFLGAWIRHAGYFPSWNLRLFKRGKAKYEFTPDFSLLNGDNEVHEHVLLQGCVGRLNEPMDHHAFPTIQTFLEKHNRYSSWEAASDAAVREFVGTADQDQLGKLINLRRKLKRMGRAIPFPHLLRFFYHYVLRAGLLDGPAGYYFCHLLAEYEFQIWAKRYELGRTRLVARSERTPNTVVEFR